MRTGKGTIKFCLKKNRAIKGATGSRGTIQFSIWVPQDGFRAVSVPEQENTVHFRPFSCQQMR